MEPIRTLQAGIASATTSLAIVSTANSVPATANVCADAARVGTDGKDRLATVKLHKNPAFPSVKWLLHSLLLAIVFFKEKKCFYLFSMDLFKNDFYLNCIIVC